MNLPLQPEKPSAVLEVIRNPMIFNAFALFVLLALGLCSHIGRAEWWAIFGSIVAITGWLNIFGRYQSPLPRLWAT